MLSQLRGYDVCIVALWWLTAKVTLVTFHVRALGPGARLRGCDALALALGVRARAAVPGALTFRDQRDSAQLEHVVDELRSGALRGLAVTVPAGVAWTLPVYGLVLLAAAEVERLGLATALTLVTPERRPLAVFDAPVSAFVSALLAEGDVRIICGTAARGVDRHGLRLADGGTVAADRVIAAPALVGQRSRVSPPTSADSFRPERSVA